MLHASFELLTCHQVSLCYRSAIPVCTAVLAVFIEKKVPTGEEATGLIVLTLGVMVAVWEGSVSGSVTGLVLCCAGTVCNAAMMSTAGKVMSEKVDVLRLTFYTAPVSCAVLLPLFLIREVRLPLLPGLFLFSKAQPQHELAAAHRFASLTVYCHTYGCVPMWL